MGRGVATEPIDGPSVTEASRRRSRPSARADAEPLHLRIVVAATEPAPLNDSVPFRSRRDPLTLRRVAILPTNAASIWGNETALAISDDRGAARRRLVAAGS